MTSDDYQAYARGEITMEQLLEREQALQDSQWTGRVVEAGIKAVAEMVFGLLVCSALVGVVVGARWLLGY